MAGLAVIAGVVPVAVAHGWPLPPATTFGAGSMLAPASASGAPIADCDRNAIAAAMRDAFPPAPRALRIRSSTLLATCRAVGAEGVLVAALREAGDASTALAMARALATFRSPVATAALREVAHSTHAAEVRAAVIPTLAALGATDDLVTLLGNVRESDEVRLAALWSLIGTGRPPDTTYLTWLRQHSGPRLGKLARQMLTAPAPSAIIAAAPAKEYGPEPPPAGGAPALAAHQNAHAIPGGNDDFPELSPSGGDVPRTFKRLGNATAAPPASPPRTGPIDGTPLAIGASTVAGGALMLNLSLLGFQDTTPQLLLGSAGAVIGFGTSWALSRFGVRPTMEQAAWFANVTAWGTLAGITIYEGSGADNYKLRYFSLVAGEASGMAVGVWSARRWRWSPSQIAMADSLFLGAALAGFGVERFGSDSPRVTPALALGIVPAMIGASIVGHKLQTTESDVALMTSAAVAGGWLGGLVASGAARTELLGSRQGQGGLLMGTGIGYLGGAAAGAFTEVPALRLEIGGIGILAGNTLGLGINMMASGISRHDAGMFAPGDKDSWKLGSGIGGAVLGATAFAMAPRLKWGARAVPMGLWGVGYGAGTYWLALAAGYHGQQQNETTDAVMTGGLLATGMVGGLTGLLLSDRFNPDLAEQWTTFGMTAAATTAGWGTAALLANQRGTPDAVGVAAGAGVGLATGAAFAHFHAERLRSPSLAAASGGTATGILVGGLLPTLGQPRWNESRATDGAMALGLGGGALLGGALGELTEATGGQVAVPAVAGTLGLGVGTGAGLLIADTDSRPTRIGAVLGTATFLGGSIVADHWLRLSIGLGPSATGLALTGGGFGAMEGLLLAGAIGDGGTLSQARGSTPAGGMLMGASAGIAGGLALSRTFAPRSGDLALAGGNSLLLASAGYGVGELAAGTDRRGATVATMSGAALGLIGGAVMAPRAHLTTPVLGGAAIGGTAATLIGTLAPSMDQLRWTDTARTDGGWRLGLAAGLLGGGAVAQLTGATSGETAIVGAGSMLGLGIGLGAGSLWPRDDTQPERIGTVVGVATLGTASLLVTRPLHLTNPLPAGSSTLVLTTTAEGIFDGVWLAAMVDPSGLPSTTPAHQLEGGVLLGGSVGLGAGLLLAPHVRLDGNRPLLLSAGTLAGVGIGRGAVLLATDTAGRADSAATLAGSLTGTLVGVLAGARLDPQPVDGAAAVVGAGYGGLLGALIPSLGDVNWPGWNRATNGGLLLGAGSGATAGMATRLSLRAEQQDVGLTALAAGDGAVTGMGWAMLLTPGDSANNPAVGDTSRRLRLGATIGTAAGMGLGMATWPHAHLGPGDAPLIAATMAVAAWNGAWIPALGHASSADFDRRHMGGGFLAAAGTASFGTVLLVPVLEIDADLIADAVALDAVFTGAGAGMGALASARADAPVTGMLAGGALGLVLGGSLHDRIAVGPRNAALLAMGAAEGLWAGSWIPYVLRAPAAITDDQRRGGSAAGAFGGLGLAVLASTRFTPAAGDVGVAVGASAVGAAITGGIALLSDSIHDQQSAGFTLGGTTIGLVAGGLLAPRLRIDLRAAESASVGGALGTSEALLFAWSARASGNDQYAGAALLGAGVGTTLGLATAATADTTGAGTPAVAGFTAWGGWMGAFAGSLFARDAHEVTTGGLLGSNLGLVAGYALLHTGAVEPGDFGWLSLFGAVGTVVGAGGGAPFASRGQPSPILAGLAIGPAVGMTVGALVLPRLRAARDAAAPSMAWTSSPPRALAPYTLAMRDGHGDGEARARDGGGRGPGPRTETGYGAAASVDVAADLESQHRTRRALARALNAAIQISDCAPLIGALPTPDSATGGTKSPMLVGLTGRWQ